jgi:hypothetical protein
MVKGAFDLYLPELVNQLGYTLPETKEGRKAFWTAINVMLLYHEEIDPKTWLEVKTEPDSGNMTIKGEFGHTIVIEQDKLISAVETPAAVSDICSESAHKPASG